MEETEKIKVFVRIKKGRTICICHRDRKGCNRQCEADVVARDKFDGWKFLYQIDRYGKTKLDNR